MVVAAKVIKVEAVEEQVAESQGTVTRKTKKETCVHHLNHMVGRLSKTL